MIDFWVPLLFAVTALLESPWSVDRQPRYRQGLVVNYTSRSLPLIARNMPGTWPAMLGFAATLAVAAIEPLRVGIWLLPVMAGWIALGVALAYGDPPRFMPRAILAEVDRRGLDVPPRSLTDSVVFWALETSMLLGAVSVVVLIVFFGYPK